MASVGIVLAAFQELPNMTACNSPKSALVVAMLLSGLVFATGQGHPAAAPPGLNNTQDGETGKFPAVAPQVDGHGDPLPPGAILRIGTQRLRHGAIVGVAWSPDGKWVASAASANGAAQSVRLWDSSTGQLGTEFQNHRAGVHAVAFSPAGKVAVSVDDIGEMYVWETATGHILKLRSMTEKAPIAFDSTGKCFASIDERGQACLVETASLKTLQIFDTSRRLFQSRVTDLAWSESGDVLATLDAVNIVRVIDASTGNVKNVFSHTALVKCLSLAPGGKTLATAGDDRLIHLWDTSTGKKLHQMTGHQGVVKAVAWSPDGKTLASGSGDFTARVWDVQSGQQIAQFTRPQAKVDGIAFSPDGKRVASGGTGGDSTVHIWEASTGKEVVTYDDHHGWLGGLAVLDGGKTLLTSATDKVIRLWDLKTGKILARLAVPHTRAKCIAVTADSKLLAVGTGAGTGTVVLRELPTGKVVKKLQANENAAIFSIAMSEDGKWIASSGSDNKTLIWNVAEGRVVQELKPALLKAHSLAFSPDAKMLCTGSMDGTLQLWDVANGQEIRRLAGHRSGYERILFSPRLNLMGSVNYDTPPEIWDPSTGKIVRRLDGFDAATALAFSPDGRTVATGGTDSTVRIWELATGQQRFKLDGHLGFVTGMAFTPDGKMLISGAVDSTGLCWDIAGHGREKSQPSRAFSAEELATHWKKLHTTSAARAYDAMLLLTASPEQALAKLKASLRPAPPLDAKAVAQWIADLEDKKFAVREKAIAELAKVGDSAWPTLRKVLENPPSLETRERILKIMGKVDDPILPLPERLLLMRDLELLERLQTPAAREFAAALASGEPDAWLTQEAQAMLKRMP
jgi:WD40 repeat protein